MKYRDHKGSLEESLNTQQIFNSIDELINHLNAFYKPFGKSIEEVKFEHIGMDSRLGWDTYYVLKRLKGESDFTVSGMSDGFLNNKNNVVKLNRDKILIDILEVTGLNSIDELEKKLKPLTIDLKSIYNFYLCTGRFPKPLEDKIILEHGFTNWYNAFKKGMLKSFNL